MDSQKVIDEVHKGTYDLGLVGMKTEDELLAFEQFYRDRLVVITPVKRKVSQNEGAERNACGMPVSGAGDTS